MTHDRSSQAVGPGSARPMDRWRYVGLHALGAGAFFFLLQHYAMDASVDTSLLWALTLGGCAAGLAYLQSNR